MGVEQNILWDKSAAEKFRKLIDKIPEMMRSFAENKVRQRAERIVKQDNRAVITEKDMIDAFFAATPFGFHGPMKNDMTELGIDYIRYGYPK